MQRDQLAAHALADEFDSRGRRTSIIYDLDQSILPTMIVKNAVTVVVAALVAIGTVQRGGMEDREPARARGAAIVRAVVNGHHMRIGAEHKQIANARVLNERTELGALGTII